MATKQQRLAKVVTGLLDDRRSVNAEYRETFSLIAAGRMDREAGSLRMKELDRSETKIFAAIDVAMENLDKSMEEIRA